MNKTPKRTRFQPTRHWIWAAKIVLKEERAKRRDPKWLPKYLTGAQQVRALLTVQGYALELEAECAAGPSPGPLADSPSSQLIKLASQGSKWKVFIVDGAYTRCGDEAPLCGTGGCPIGVFRVEFGVTTNLYDDQGLGWEISHNGSVLRVHVHGSICGGFGPDPCVTEINLENGKRRTFRPPH